MLGHFYIGSSYKLIHLQIIKTLCFEKKKTKGKPFLWEWVSENENGTGKKDSFLDVKGFALTLALGI